MRAFIFDMDGVIIDSEPLHSRIKLKTLAHYGLDFDESGLSLYMGRATKEFFAFVCKEAGRDDLDTDEMVELKHRLYLEELEGGEAGLIDGVTDILEHLKERNIPTALASSAGREIIDAVLTRFELKKYFSVVLSGAELARSKPDPAIYLLAAEKLGVLPGECVVLEDATSGVTAAKAANMYCIGFVNPNSGEQDLSLADKKITRLKDAIKIIEEKHKNRLAFFGDSLICGFPYGEKYSWATLGAHLAKRKFLSFGVCGETIHDIVCRIKESTLPDDVSTIILAGGANDVLTNCPLKVSLNAAREAKEYAEKKGVDFLIVLPLLTGEEYYDEKLTRLRDGLKEIGYTLDLMDAEAKTTDGFHPTTEGYEKMAHLAAPFLKNL